MEQTYFRKGFGLRAEIRSLVDGEYHSALVERIRARGYVDQLGPVQVRLAEEFGFCYGVDRAVDYAYETRLKFPDRTIYLVGEIIHNPHVNRRMKEMGIIFLYPKDGVFDFSGLTTEDVVLLPAFGVTISDFEALKRVGCVLVDTTCGSVLHVWKRVEAYARDGYTALIHGKYTHEESRATASQVERYDGGTFVIVRDMDEAMLICDYIAERPGAMSTADLKAHFALKASPHFAPDVHLQRVGVANQTTMLANESLAIGAKVRDAMVERHGDAKADEHFRSFGTICSATQERQDAILKLMEDPPDRMIVIGGYNSSNTNHLAHICRDYTPTYHIADAQCIDVESGHVRHKVELDPLAPEIEDQDWLPEGPFSLGITAGASTPNNKIGEAIVRVLAILGVETEEV